MAEQSLKDKTVKGVGWSAVDNVSQYAVSFLVSIVLARLLSPDDYGLIGIIAIFTSICTALIDGGFDTALVRKKDASDEDFNTVFIVNFGMSILLYTIIFICAPLIANFFNREELVSLTRVSSIGFVIAALSMVQRTRLTKRIDFKTQTKITLTASFLSGFLGISMALLGCGVWSLVGQQLAVQVIRTILLWVYNKWVPQICFSVKSFQELFGFGWKMVASGLLDTVWKELYQVVVGKYYSPATLGQYTRSNQFASLLSSNINSVISRVTYPVLSSIQDNKTRLLSGYRNIITITMFITSISMFFLGAISEPLLYCLIGPKWHEAAIYLPLICISSSAYPLQALNLNMLKVQGRSDLFLGLEIIKKIIALGPLFVGAFVGIVPMLCVNIVTTIIAFFLNSYYSGKYIGYSSWMQVKDVAPSYGIAFIIAVSVYFLKYLPISYWIILPIQIVFGVSLFLVICSLLKPREYKELLIILKPLISKFNHEK